PHMVWTASSDGRVDFSNQRWREYVGGDGTRTWLDAIHPDEQVYALERWNHSLATREPLTLEVRLAGGGWVASEAAGGGIATAVFRTFVVKATPITQGHAVKSLGA